MFISMQEKSIIERIELCRLVWKIHELYIVIFLVCIIFRKCHSENDAGSMHVLTSQIHVRVLINMYVYAKNCVIRLNG